MEAVLNEREAHTQPWGAAALEQRRERTRNHLASIAPRRETWINRNTYYYELLSRLLVFWWNHRKRLLSVRCGTGNLLAVVRPCVGKGVDICAEIVKSHSNEIQTSNSRSRFQTRKSSGRFSRRDEKFDYILFNDIGDTVDVLEALRNLKPLCQRHTRVVDNNLQSSLGTIR